DAFYRFAYCASDVKTQLNSPHKKRLDQTQPRGCNATPPRLFDSKRAGARVEGRGDYGFAQVSYGSVDSYAPAFLVPAWRMRPAQTAEAPKQKNAVTDGSGTGRTSTVTENEPASPLNTVT